MLKSRRALIALALGFVLVLAQVASAAGTHDTVGAESKSLITSLDQFMDQRVAPADQLPAAAFMSGALAAATLSVAPGNGSWTEIGPKNYHTDDPSYADPVWSNAGDGVGLASGRITALAVTKDGRTVFAGGAGGGVWKSTDGGQNWTPVTDNQYTLSTGSLALDDQGGGTYTVYWGTGEANTNSDSYAGVGVLKSLDGGNSWQRMGGDELLGVTVYRIAVDPVDHTRLYAATSRGLWLWQSGATAWQRVLPAAGVAVGLTNYMVTDVAVRPGTGGATGDVLAVVGWRNGAATNGLYESKDGGPTFTALNPQGYVTPQTQGRVSLAYAADGSRLYAVVQDPSAMVDPKANSVLGGVYVSRSGDPNGPYTKIADYQKLMNAPGSAMEYKTMGRGYQPGVQAWYDQFVTVDPTNPDHAYVGLEEVYETTDLGANWTTIGAYWNYGLACGSTCPPTTHSDQHAAVIAGGTLWVGNDGGVWSRSLAVHQPGNWSNLNQTLDTLQYYYAAGGKAANGPATFYGGLQDNGVSKVVPAQQFSAEPFGGDGGDVVVDPSNPDNVITEYVYLTMAKSTDGGHNWTGIGPNDPNPRFIAPFAMDANNSSHLVAGGQYVWDSSKGFGTVCNSTACDWQNVYDTGSGHSITAIHTVSGTPSGSATYAAWCGPCNSSGFASGLASNVGGTWHSLPLPAHRFVTSIWADPANGQHVLLTFSGYSRRWIPNAGYGHVWESVDGGQTWADRSGNLPDVPASAIVVAPGSSGHSDLVVGTDVGVFVSADNGTTWQHLGANLPHVIVDDLRLTPGDNGLVVLAATHGRGMWALPTAQLP